jgi:hypothetical protein
MDSVQPVHHFVIVSHGIDEGAASQSLRKRTRPQIEADDDRKESRTGPSGRPKQFGILVLIRVDEFSIGRNHIDGRYALAGPSPAASIPSHSAL